MGAAQVGVAPPLYLQMQCPLLIMPAELVSQKPTETQPNLSSPRHIERPLQCGGRNTHSETTIHPCATLPRALLLAFAPFVWGSSPHMFGIDKLWAVPIIPLHNNHVGTASTVLVRHKLFNCRRPCKQTQCVVRKFLMMSKHAHSMLCLSHTKVPRLRLY